MNKEEANRIIAELNGKYKLLGEWKKYDLIEGYFISSYGHIASSKNSTYRILKTHEGNSGYLKITFSHGNRSINKMIHREVARHFIGECPEGYQVNHIDENKHNNRVDNLEYVTQEQNMRHTYDLRRMSKECAEAYREIDSFMGYRVDRLCLNALVPVWEKLNYVSLEMHNCQDKGIIHNMVWAVNIFNPETDNYGEGKSIQEAACIATAKAIRELK